MNLRTRHYFDEQLEWVLARLPAQVHALLEEIPLHVEDYPSAQVMREMGVRYRDDLCGLFTGVPLDERSVTHPFQLPDAVTIYREGIFATAADRQGRMRIGRLRKEIRITILHELAHYHGLSEEELKEMGYG
jgi:predicted Zn-dependent protease with MMP-like domain